MEKNFHWCAGNPNLGSTKNLQEKLDFIILDQLAEEVYKMARKTTNFGVE
jgi:hypothetical protein